MSNDNPYAPPRELTTEPRPWRQRKLVAFVVGAVAGAVLRFLSGPDDIKPYLFIPDILLSAMLLGAAATVISSLVSRLKRTD